jgi:DNA-directed RNA polymerase specialized sigma24 family protein
MMNAGETELDEVLVQRTRRGDAVALAALATRYWNALHRIGWNMLSDPAAAGELAEAALLSALRSTEAFPRDVPFRTALYRQAISRSLIRLHSAPSSATRSLATFGGRHLGEWIREKLQHLDAWIAPRSCCGKSSNSPWRTPRSCFGFRRRTSGDERIEHL